jgi:hypothetical protein
LAVRGRLAERGSNRAQETREVERFRGAEARPHPHPKHFV